VGVDATTLEANAAMRSIVRRDNGASYDEFLTGLARQSGIETPTREDLVRIDRKRKKKTSNREWVSPSDPDARVAKMKDGTTHLAHKAEHAVDMESGAVIAVTLQAADQGDTTTIRETLAETAGNLAHVMEREAEQAPEAEPQVSLEPLAEIVGDKGYHSSATVLNLQQAGARTYIPELKRERRQWACKADEQKAVYANRRRVQGDYGKKLLKKRGASCPSADPDPRSRPIPTERSYDVFPHRSTAASGRSSNGWGSVHPARCAETPAVRVNRWLAMQCRVRNRSPRSTQSTATGSKFPESTTGARCDPNKTARTPVRRIRRTARRPAVRSTVGRRDGQAR